MATGGANFDSFGSLAQSARKSQLKKARNMLFCAGAVYVVLNFIAILNAESMVKREIDREVEKVRRQGMVVDQAALQQIQDAGVKAVMLFHGINVGLGIVFVAFGFLVNQFPIPITITSVILFLGVWATYGFLHPPTLLTNIIPRIIVIVSLVSAVKAALAYEKELKEQPFSPEMGGEVARPPGPVF